MLRLANGLTLLLSQASQPDQPTPITKGIQDTYMAALRLAKSMHTEDLLDAPEYSLAKEQAGSRYNDALVARQAMIFEAAPAATSGKKTGRSPANTHNSSSSDDEMHQEKRARASPTSKRPRTTRSAGSQNNSHPQKNPSRKSYAKSSKCQSAKEILDSQLAIMAESTTPLWYCDPSKEVSEMTQAKMFGNRIPAMHAVEGQEVLLWRSSTCPDLGRIAECLICKIAEKKPGLKHKIYPLEVSISYHWLISSHVCDAPQEYSVPGFMKAISGHNRQELHHVMLSSLSLVHKFFLLTACVQNSLAKLIKAPEVDGVTGWSEWCNVPTHAARKTAQAKRRQAKSRAGQFNEAEGSAVLDNEDR